jgi:dienelactone hydrolase
MNLNMKIQLVTRMINPLFITLMFLFLHAVSLQAQIPEGNPTLIKDVTFETEDGWILHATLYLPPETGDTPLPGMVIMSEPDWVPRSISDEISLGVVEIGMAALAVDVRGTDASFGEKEFQLFTQEERDAMQLDVRAAVEYLASLDEVDGNRIAVFGASIMVDYVAREAGRNLSQIKALILSTGWLTDAGREAIQYRKDLPVLTLVSEDDPRDKQELASEPFYRSADRGSRLMFVMDRGASIFNRPGQPIKRTTDWLQENLIGTGYQSAVSFRTEDRKLLRGTLYMPDGKNRNPAPVAGVVFIHGANHDATTWWHLAREVTKTGLASLIFDQRGYMHSVPNERPFAFDIETIKKDIKAAINFLASRSGVNPDRIALVTATSRGGPAVAAAYGDERIKAIVGLSFYGGNEDTNRYITEMDIPFFLVASSNDIRADGRSLVDATRESYRLSNNKETELIIYDDAGRGSAMLKTKPELTGMVVRWIKEKLSK